MIVMMGNRVSSQGQTVFVMTAARLLCRRGAIAFNHPFIAPFAAQHHSFHHNVRSIPSTYASSTRLKQNQDADDNSSRNEVEPTWVYTPYKPPSTQKAHNKSITRPFSSSPGWKIPDVISIPDDALQITFARSSGAGGQNVNKLNTKVEIRFHLDSATWLPLEVRDRLKTNEANRINKEGYFNLTCQEHRTQVQNRKEAMNKLHEIIKESWKRPKVRKMRNGLSKKTKENRMELKRRIGEKKASRKKVDF